MIVLGIDIGKSEFACELVDGEKHTHKKFNNTIHGFEQLSAWLRNRKARKVHACMEATGGWSEELAAYLQDRGHVVSIVNPLQIRAFGQSELSRTKTDKADAALIARYCIAMHPPAWDAPTLQERRLRQLVRRRRALMEMQTQERNRLEAPGMENVSESLHTTIAFLKKEIKLLDQQITETIDGDDDLRGKRDLIESIDGVGPATTATVLAEAPHIDAFPNARAFSAFAGVCPQEHRSGTSVSHSHVTRIGNRPMQQMLYMAGMSARRHNPIIKRFAERLESRGKRPMQIMVAVMHKLVVLIYGAVKTGKPFDPAWGA
jgi:transposase